MGRQRHQQSRWLRSRMASCLCLRPSTTDEQQVTHALQVSSPIADARAARCGGQDPANLANQAKQTEENRGGRPAFLTWRAKVWPAESDAEEEAPQVLSEVSTAAWLSSLQQTPLPRESPPQMGRNDSLHSSTHIQSGSDTFAMDCSTSEEEGDMSMETPRHMRTWSIASAGTDAHRRTLSVSNPMAEGFLHKFLSLDVPSSLSKTSSLTTQPSGQLQPSSSLGKGTSLGRPSSLSKIACPQLPRSTRISHYRALSGPWYEVDLSS